MHIHCLQYLLKQVFYLCEFRFGLAVIFRKDCFTFLYAEDILDGMISDFLEKNSGGLVI
jgi:hypothetical protein